MSTTLDVVLCLLLVSAAVGVLAAAGPPPEQPDARSAGHVADRLASTVVVVHHRPAGGIGSTGAGSTGAGSTGAGGSGANSPGAGGSGADGAGTGELAVHGTPAVLLAHAAVTDAAIRDGSARARNRPSDSSGASSGASSSAPSSASSSEYERAVENRTATMLAAMGVDERTNVTATYAPVPGSGVVGRSSVGPQAPSDVDVSVARVRVPVGTGPRRATLVRAARDDGFDGLARAVADATTSTIAPPARTRWALRDPATRARVVSRYGRFGRALGVDPTPALAGGRVRRANELLARALADRYVVALRERFDAPATAATSAAVRPRTVTITIRTWSP